MNSISVLSATALTVVRAFAPLSVPVDYITNYGAARGSKGAPTAEVRRAIDANPQYFWLDDAGVRERAGADSFPTLNSSDRIERFNPTAAIRTLDAYLPKEHLDPKNWQSLLFVCEAAHILASTETPEHVDELCQLLLKCAEKVAPCGRTPIAQSLLALATGLDGSQLRAETRAALRLAEGMVAFELEDTRTARQIFHEVERSIEDGLERSDPVLWEIYAATVGCCLVDGDVDAAERYFEKLTSMGLQDSNYAIEELRLGGAIDLDRKDYRRLEDRVTRALDLCNASYSPAHTVVIGLKNSLALGMLCLGREDEALAILNEGISDSLEALPDEPFVDVAYLYSARSDVYYKRGAYRKSRKDMRRALAITESNYGKSHPRLTFRHNKLGRIYELRGRHAQALESYAAALRSFPRTLRAKDPRRLGAIIRGLEVSLIIANRVSDSSSTIGADPPISLDAACRRVVSIARACLDAPDPQLLGAAGMLCVQAGEIELAAQCINVGVDLVTRGHANAEFLARACHTIGRQWMDRGASELAADFFTKTLALSEDSKLHGFAFRELGYIQSDKHALDDALESCERALFAFEAADAHDWSLVTTEQLLLLLSKLDRPNLRDKYANELISRFEQFPDALELKRHWWSLVYASIVATSQEQAVGKLSRVAMAMEASGADLDGELAYVKSKIAERVPGRSMAAALELEISNHLEIALTRGLQRRDSVELLAVASLATQVGRTTNARRMLAAAEWLRWASSELGGDSTLCEAWHKLGRAYEEKSELSEALEAYQRAYYFCSAEDAILGVLCHDIADIRKDLGDLVQARDMYTRAVEIKTKSSSSNRQISVSLLMLGRTLLALNQSDEALLAFEKRLSLLNPESHADSRAVAVTLHDMGSAMVRMKKLSEALQLFEEAFTLKRRANAPGGDQLATLTALVATATRLSRFDSAIAALELGRALVDENAEGIAWNYYLVEGEYFYAVCDFHRADRSLKSSIDGLEKLGIGPQLVSIKLLRVRVLEILGDLESALSLAHTSMSDLQSLGGRQTHLWFRAASVLCRLPLLSADSEVRIGLEWIQNRCAQLGPADEDYLDAQWATWKVSWALGRLRNCVEVSREILDLESKGGSESREVLSAFLTHVNSLIAMGSVQEARNLLAQAHVRKDLLAQDSTQKASMQLSECLLSLAEKDADASSDGLMRFVGAVEEVAISDRAAAVGLLTRPSTRLALAGCIRLGDERSAPALKAFGKSVASLLPPTSPILLALSGAELRSD